MRCWALAVAIIPLLVACTSPAQGPVEAGTAQNAGNDTAASSLFAEGQIELSCNLGCAFAAGFNQRSLGVLYEEQDWRQLAEKVMSIGADDDLYYFFLGASAEGLGYRPAAAIYYRKAIVIAGDRRAGLRCSNDCGGVNVALAASDGLERVRDAAPVAAPVATAPAPVAAAPQDSSLQPDIQPAPAGSFAKITQAPFNLDGLQFGASVAQVTAAWGVPDRDAPLAPGMPITELDYTARGATLLVTSQDGVSIITLRTARSGNVLGANVGQSSAQLAGAWGPPDAQSPGKWSYNSRELVAVVSVDPASQIVTAIVLTGAHPAAIARK